MRSWIKRRERNGEERLKMDKTLFRLLDLSRDMSERIVELKDNVDRQERAARKRKKYKRHAIRDF